jgi:predicted RNA-binding protein with PIN domain
VARLIVDGMNVIGSRPDGWWRDRPAAVRRLLVRLQELAAASTTSDDLLLVLDGRPLPGLPEGTHHGVRVLYARRRGPNAADDRIVEEVQHDPNATATLIITSDRGLRDRLIPLGATVEGAGTLLRRLDEIGA